MARRTASRKAARRGPARAQTRSTHSTLGRSLYHRRLRLEPLEDRRLLAVVTVTTLADTIDFTDGVTSLREAIFATNTVPGADTIDFAPSLFANGPGTILLEHGELAITDALEINGPGASVLTIDAQQQSRIFSITVLAGDFTFAGMTLTGGQINNSGGAIRSSTLGQLTLDQMVVRDNSATGTGGGVFGRNITLIHSTVSGNSAIGRGGGINAVYLTVIESTVSDNSTAGNNARGGGLFASVATLSDSVIRGNSTTGRGALGGGIYAGIGAVFTRCIIVGNSTTGNGAGGGGIANYGYPFGSITGIELIESAVIGNSTRGVNADGGGISVWGGLLPVTLTKSIVSGNSTLGDRSRGGGMFLLSGDVTISYSKVADNWTAGGARSEGGGISSSGRVVLNNTSIIGNSATGNGGGMEVRGGADITSSTISGNVSARNGGGIFVYRYSLNLFHSTITSNHADSGGGVAVFYASDGHLNHSVVAMNESNSGSDLIASMGGVIDSSFSVIGDGVGSGLAESRIGISDAKGNLIGGPVYGVIDPLLGPLADNGGFELPDGSRILTHALLAGSPAINAGDLNAVAGQNGVPEFDQRGEPFARIVGGRIDIGAFEYQEPAPLNLLVDTLADESDGDFSRGDLSLREAIELTNATTYAGITDTIRFDPALTVAGPATILLTMIASEAPSLPGNSALLITDSLTINGPGADLLTLDASGNDPTPEENNGDGSRVLCINDEVAYSVNDIILEGLTLTGADSSDVGGGVASNENLTVIDSTIHDNFSMFSGGGIRSSGNLVVTGTTIVGNSSPEGGGIRNFGSLTTISDSTISNNTAASGGGGLYVGGAKLAIVRSSINDNLAGRGGAISFVGNGSKMELTDSSIIGNSVVSDGVLSAGIHVLGLLTDIELINCTVSGNAGVGIYGHYINLTAIESTVTGNSRSGILAGTASVTKSSIDGNAGWGIIADTLSVRSSTIRDNGGVGIAASVLSVTDSIVHGNLDRGIVGSDVTVRNSTISGNSTISYGGGISSYGQLALYDSTISGNSAHDKAGGIYSKGNLLLVNSTISGNSTNGEGGGLYLTGSGLADIRHSTIAFNTAGSFGSGILVNSTGLALDHTIVAQNVGSNRDLNGLLGSTITATYSLIGMSGGSGLVPAPVGSPDAHGNLIGGTTPGSRIDAVEPTLADNGGPTMTHSLRFGSPALNAGDPNAVAGADAVPVHDQRGAPFVRVYGGRIDIGAVEAIPAGFLPGDYNEDGVVDAGDYASWRNSMGGVATPPGSGADGNGDGEIDALDYAVWKANYGSMQDDIGGGGGAGLIAEEVRIDNGLDAESAVVADSVSTLLRSDHRPRHLSRRDAAAMYDHSQIDAALVAWLEDCGGRRADAGDVGEFTAEGADLDDDSNVARDAWDEVFAIF